MSIVSENDKEITCKDCGSPFTFSEREQSFFNEKGLTEPKRCKACRDKKKAQKQSGRY